MLESFAISFSYTSISAIGFFIYYTGSRNFSFHYAALIPLSSYTFLCLSGQLNDILAIVLGLSICFLVSGAFGFFYNQFNINSGFIFLIFSLGFYIAITNIISILFGDEIQLFSHSSNPPTAYLLSTVLVIYLGTFMLFKSKTGLRFQAYGENAVLAEISGFDKSKLFFLFFAISGFIAGISGLLLAYDSGTTPTIGFNLLLMGIIAMIIGGTSLSGCLVGSFFLTLVTHAGTYVIGSQWKEVVAYGLLFLALLVFPNGTFKLGRKRMAN